MSSKTSQDFCETHRSNFGQVERDLCVTLTALGLGDQNQQQCSRRTSCKIKESIWLWREHLWRKCKCEKHSLVLAEFWVLVERHVSTLASWCSHSLQDKPETLAMQRLVLAATSRTTKTTSRGKFSTFHRQIWSTLCWNTRTCRSPCVWTTLSQTGDPKPSSRDPSDQEVQFYEGDPRICGFCPENSDSKWVQNCRNFNLKTGR